MAKPTHERPATLGDQLKKRVPFGLGQTKPHHYREMASVLWENRDNLPYAWKVLSKGVCDGCALGVSGFRDWTIDGVHLCMTRLRLLRLNTMPALDPEQLRNIDELCDWDNRQLRELGRLSYPMRRRKGDRGFERISWEQAYETIAKRIRQSDPERIAFFLTSRGLTNETYYVAQKVARYLGTNNIDNAARLCHSPSTGAMKRSLGVAASTCSYSDWIGSDLLVFFGSNPANDQPVTTKYIEQAKRHGTKVALVNPYREPGMERYWVPSSTRSALFGTDILDYWFPVHTGGDTAFLYGVLKVLITEGWWDHGFVEECCEGFSELMIEIEKLSWQSIEQGSGLSTDRIAEFAEIIHRAKTAVFIWSMGITQHVNGADAVQMILNLALSQAFVGREKCGVMPIRGHSGVQGGAEMGAYATAFPGGKAISEENARDLEAHYKFTIPDNPGLSAVEMVDAAKRQNLDLLYCLGGNLLRTLPNPKEVKGALENIPLRVHQDIILTDQMLLNSGEEVLLLPAKTRYEQEGGGTETTTERRILFGPELPRQVGEARSEWRILRDIAIAVRPDAGDLLGCQDGPAIRREIAAVIPFYKGIETLQQIGDSLQYGGIRLCGDRDFPTEDGKAHFFAPALRQDDYEPNVFRLSTRRGKQFNTLIYSDYDPLNGAPRDAILISSDDARNLGLENSHLVTLRNSHGEFRGRLFFAAIARGNLQVHWPEGNTLIPSGIRDPAGGVPDYNATVQIVGVASA